MAVPVVSDELWAVVEPLLPEREPQKTGRPRIDDRRCLSGILFVLATGIAWGDLPQQLGYGSGVTCWRRLRDWQQAGVWERLHRETLRRLNAAGQIDWTTSVVDGSHIRALQGGSHRALAR